MTTVWIRKKNDCVAMKRRGSLRIYRATRNMSPAEKLEYWQRKDRDLLAEQAELRLRGNAARQFPKSRKRA
jgi:IS4 transposase